MSLDGRLKRWGRRALIAIGVGAIGAGAGEAVKWYLSHQFSNTESERDALGKLDRKELVKIEHALETFKGAKVEERTSIEALLKRIQEEALPEDADAREKRQKREAEYGARIARLRDEIALLELRLKNVRAAQEAKQAAPPPPPISLPKETRPPEDHRRLAVPGSAFDFFDGGMTEKDIERFKEKTIREIMYGKQGFWQHDEVRNFVLSHYFPGSKTDTNIQSRLRLDSRLQARMYIPQRGQVDELMKRHGPRIEELVRMIPEQRYGLFFDRSKGHIYVIGNMGGSKRQFTVCFPIIGPFAQGNVPPGLYFVADQTRGILGEEVVLDEKSNLGGLQELSITNIGKDGLPLAEKGYFVRSLDQPKGYILGGITVEYVLVRQRSAEITSDQKVRLVGAVANWQTSSGTIPASIFDAHIVWQFINPTGMPGEGKGTPVMIQ